MNLADLAVETSQEAMQETSDTHVAGFPTQNETPRSPLNTPHTLKAFLGCMAEEMLGTFDPHAIRYSDTTTQVRTVSVCNRPLEIDAQECSDDAHSLISSFRSYQRNEPISSTGSDCKVSIGWLRARAEQNKAGD